MRPRFRDREARADEGPEKKKAPGSCEPEAESTKGEVEETIGASREVCVGPVVMHEQIISSNLLRCSKHVRSTQQFVESIKKLRS